MHMCLWVSMNAWTSLGRGQNSMSEFLFECSQLLFLYVYLWGVYTSIFALCGHMCVHTGCVYMSLVHLRTVVDWGDFLNNFPF